MEIINPEIAKAYERLAAAIVMQAVKDYRSAFSFLKNARRKSRKTYEAENKLNNCKRFFRSEWFGQLCEYDGEKLMKQIEKEHFKKIGLKYV